MTDREKKNHETAIRYEAYKKANPIPKTDEGRRRAKIKEEFMATRRVQIKDCGGTIYEMDVELTKEQQTLLDEPLLVSMEAKEERGAKLSPEVCKAIKDGAYVSMELGSCYASPKIIKAEF